MHFVLPFPSWYEEGYQTDKNDVAFALFDIEKEKYTFNGDIRFYSPIADRKMIRNAVKKRMEEDMKYFYKQRNINYFIHNWGFTDRGSSVEDFVKNYIEFFVNQHKFKTKGKVFEYNNVVKRWMGLQESSMVYLADSKEFKNGFGDTRINAEYLFPKSIVLDEWQPICFGIKRRIKFCVFIHIRKI